jgi:anaerobic ribonucleoside-triphosphate reductase activating protein
MNYLQIDKSSISNGPGVRVVLWVSGCTLYCKGCQNPESWDFCAGKSFDENAKRELFEALNKSYIRGISISGGHPLEYENLPDVYELIKEIKTKFPEKDVWLYTGHTLSINNFDTTVDICFDNGLLKNYILAICDVVVDGPYIEEQRDITLKFRGSKNQRLIDVKETMKQGTIKTIQN